MITHQQIIEQPIQWIAGHEPVRGGEYPIFHRAGQPVAPGDVEIEQITYRHANYGDHGLGWFDVWAGGMVIKSVAARAVAEIKYMPPPAASQDDADDEIGAPIEHGLPMAQIVRIEPDIEDDGFATITLQFHGCTAEDQARRSARLESAVAVTGAVHSGFGLWFVPGKGEVTLGQLFDIAAAMGGA
jgi:hypothetical protein